MEFLLRQDRPRALRHSYGRGLRLEYNTHRAGLNSAIMNLGVTNGGDKNHACVRRAGKQIGDDCQVVVFIQVKIKQDEFGLGLFDEC